MAAEFSTDFITQKGRPVYAAVLAYDSAVDGCWVGEF
jgi:hypothetical protein